MARPLPRRRRRRQHERGRNLWAGASLITGQSCAPHRCEATSPLFSANETGSGTQAQGAVAEERSANAGSGAGVNGTIPPFERIVGDYGPLISRIAMSYEADPALREDLTQQILL